MNKNNFPEKLLFLRTKNKMTQKQLAKYLNVSDRAISKWESGISNPAIDNLISLSKLFNTSIDSLFISDKKVKRNTEIVNKTGMESLKELYRIGHGPSSSHTIGPERICKHFLNEYPQADAFEIVLYGSLAKTGKGHGTDKVIEKTLYPKAVKITYNYSEDNLPHPNTLDITVLKDGKVLEKQCVCSIGGGKFEICGSKETEKYKVYSFSTLKEISEYCLKNNLRLYQYAEICEGEEIREYIRQIWDIMKNSIQSGLTAAGVLPGTLQVSKKAKKLLNSEHIDETPETKENRLISAYAFAVSEQNASGETIVTAPTCGSAGVLPAVLFYEQQKKGFSDEQIINSILTAGIIGNLIKTNASISGAECGCQAEIGSACAMASAALGELFGLSMDKIEYAAEIAIEHHLGLTCDPICGYVQIPCIERNAVAAMRAINAINIASFLSGTRKISFDNVVSVMKKTGLDISKRYKETSEAGLAEIIINN